MRNLVNGWKFQPRASEPLGFDKHRSSITLRRVSLNRGLGFEIIISMFSVKFGSTNFGFAESKDPKFTLGFAVAMQKCENSIRSKAVT